MMIDEKNLDFQSLAHFQVQLDVILKIFYAQTLSVEEDFHSMARRRKIISPTSEQIHGVSIQ